MAPTDYDALAAGYDQRYRDRSYPGVERSLRRLFEGATGPVVEVGCGTAQWVRMLRKLGVAVTGLDASAAMLSVARTRAAGHLLRASATQLPLVTGSVQGVYCVHALHHFPDKSAFAREVARVLAPGGSFVVISLDPHRGEDRWVVYDYWPETYAHDLSRYLSSEQLTVLCDAAGLARIEYDVAERLDETRSAAQLLRRGDELKRSTSQLADLRAEAWALGLMRLERDAAAAHEAGGAPLLVQAMLRLSVWVFRARS